MRNRVAVKRRTGRDAPTRRAARAPGRRGVITWHFSPYGQVCDRVQVLQSSVLYIFDLPCATLASLGPLGIGAGLCRFTLRGSATGSCGAATPIAAAPTCMHMLAKSVAAALPARTPGTIGTPAMTRGDRLRDRLRDLELEWLRDRDRRCRWRRRSWDLDLDRDRRRRRRFRRRSPDRERERDCDRDREECECERDEADELRLRRPRRRRGLRLLLRLVLRVWPGPGAGLWEPREPGSFGP